MGRTDQKVLGIRLFFAFGISVQFCEKNIPQLKFKSIRNLPCYQLCFDEHSIGNGIYRTVFGKCETFSSVILTTSQLQFSFFDLTSIIRSIYVPYTYQDHRCKNPSSSWPFGDFVRVSPKKKFPRNCLIRKHETLEVDNFILCFWWVFFFWEAMLGLKSVGDFWAEERRCSKWFGGRVWITFCGKQWTYPSCWVHKSA